MDSLESLEFVHEPLKPSALCVSLEETGLATYNLKHTTFA